MPPIIIYHYTFIHGGLADFLKFFFHTMDLCSFYGLTFRIFVDHPIQDYIQWNHAYRQLCLHKIPEHAYFIGPRNSLQGFDQILSDHQDEAYLVLCSLDFFSYHIRFDGLANELNFLAVTKEFILEDYMQFRFPETMYIPTRPFVCIHVRMGDKYASILPNVEYCDQDDRSMEKAKLCHHISKILGMIDDSEFDVFFISDNSELKKDMLAVYPVLRSTMKKIEDEIILNISYPIDDNDLFRKGLELSLSEFQILRRADFIYALSYSGFTVMANHLKLNAEQQLFKLYDI